MNKHLFKFDEFNLFSMGKKHLFFNIESSRIIEK